MLHATPRALFLEKTRLQQQLGGAQKQAHCLFSRLLCEQLMAELGTERAATRLAQQAAGAWSSALRLSRNPLGGGQAQRGWSRTRLRSLYLTSAFSSFTSPLLLWSRCTEAVLSPQFSCGLRIM